MAQDDVLSRTISFAICALLSWPLSAAELVPVIHPEGSTRAFLLLRSPDGKVIAEGDYTQTLRRDIVVSRLLFRFRDGSRDDETTEFSQNHCIRLLHDHHIQKGPSFAHPEDVTIDTPTNQVTVGEWDREGNQRQKTDHVDLPADLANGILLHVLKNMASSIAEMKLSYLAATPKPRLVQVAVTRQGREAFSVAGVSYHAAHFKIKIELGGIAGVVAPLIGKEPADVNVWLTEGDPPTLVRLDGPLYLGGPVWNLQLAVPVWPTQFRVAR